MPFPWKIQPVDFSSSVEPAFLKSVVKSRFKRLFERPFANVLRITAPEKAVTDGESDQMRTNKDDLDEFEPSSICLANMVKNFIEEGADNKQLKCSRSKCYCFNDIDGSDDEEIDSRHVSACEMLKNLVLCSTVTERNVLADTVKIVEKNIISMCKNDCSRKAVTDGLIALGYDASICKSRWETTPKYPAGEYDYIDVIKGGERLIIDIDFRSEFKIARSTKNYNAILEILPEIFVGKADRLEKIIHLVSEEAKKSLKKKDMHLPPWRRADYVKSKWLSRHNRSAPQQSVTPPLLTPMESTNFKVDRKILLIETGMTITSPLIAAVKSPASSDRSDTVFSLSEEEEAQ